MAAHNLSPDAFISSHFAQTRNHVQNVYQDLQDHSKGYVSVTDLFNGLRKQGLEPTKNSEIINLIQQNINPNDTIKSEQELLATEVPFDTFFNVVGDKDNDNIIARAFNNKLAIPDWEKFTEEITGIFEEVRANDSGKNADYIPQLAEVDPNLYGISVCTVDGQEFSKGDWDTDFTIQSCSKVFTYCVAAEDHGPEYVHEHIGFEPSGVAFNAFQLDDNNKPHNPMINAGAITTCSLIRNDLTASKRFTYITERFSEFAGDSTIGFDNATYLSEKDTADRNFALSYYMQENKVFPANTRIEDTLDLYFQVCSVLVSSKKLATMAATLANGGICPLTNKRCASPTTVKCVLQLMYSSGMYDYSGEWMNIIGIPAKSGVAGAITVVIPGVMGITMFSPRLDRRGNSVRGIDFFARASKHFKWSIFDQLVREPEENTDDVDEEQQTRQALEHQNQLSKQMNQQQSLEHQLQHQQLQHQHQQQQQSEQANGNGYYDARRSESVESFNNNQELKRKRGPGSFVTPDENTYTKKQRYH
jgi:glutaminase